MDVEFELLYQSLLVHHLDRPEIEYELKIRGLPFTGTEPRAALMRRLKEHLKIEKDRANRDIEFERLETTIDDEIKTIDAKVKEIKDFLTNRTRFEGIRDSLKTRLAHYFARTKRLPENTENDEDLKDIDELISCIRGAFNTHFSLFSGQREVLEQLNQSFSKLLVASQNASQNKKKVRPSREEDHEESAEGDEEAEETPEASNSSGKRSLKSVNKQVDNFNAPSNFLPFMMPPWMFGNPQMQMWAIQQMLRPESLEGFPHPQVGKKGSDRADKPREKSKKSSRSARSRVRSSSSESKKSSSTEAGWSSEEPRRTSREKKHDQRSDRRRPVSDWKLKYDGSDNGQTLMKFLKEVEFYAKSENMPPKNLFRSAIHLFNGAAKTWFMTGFENEDFTSWEELKEELKREFLSPDHDHSSEIRAIARKQGPRESFQDYFLELQKLFNSLTKPMTEGRKFEIVFRNMRADYKGHAVASDINNLVDLKKFGRRLDATYWFKYQTSATDSNPRGKPSQVNELNTGTKPKTTIRSDEKHKSRTFRNSNFDRRESEEERNPSEKKPSGPSESKGVKDGFQVLLEKYQPPREGICYNCRLRGHHARECEGPKHKYCQRCGFHGAVAATCPWCTKNASKTVSEGRQFERQ